MSLNKEQEQEQEQEQEHERALKILIELEGLTHEKATMILCMCCFRHIAGVSDSVEEALYHLGSMNNELKYRLSEFFRDSVVDEDK